MSEIDFYKFITDTFDGKVQDGLVEAFAAYEGLPQTEEYCIVKKGNILKATKIIPEDSRFYDSQMLILGQMEDLVLGTSLRKTDRTFLYRATWQPASINHEISKLNAWEFLPSLGAIPIEEYFYQLNTLRS